MHSTLNEPCPTYATGALIASAVLEHSANTSTATEFAMMAAMTCAAAVVQDIADVQRPGLPPSPTSVICVGVAATGAGKSTAAKPFLLPFELVQQKLDQTADDHLEFEAKQLIWKEKLAYLRSGLRRKLNDEAATEKAERDIARHMRQRPIAPPQAKLLYDNVTPTALRRNLATWPSGLLVSMDAGHVLNGAIGRDLDQLNSLWDGDTMRSDTTDISATAYGPRVSALLFTQPTPTMRYMSRRGEDAHGTGFFARTDWLLPPPTRPAASAGLSAKTHRSIETYQSRMTDLLEMRIRSRKAGDDSRRVVEFSADGAAYFNDLYLRIRSLSAPGGALQGLGGYAAKIPERIARYACVVHVFNDLPGLISAETLHHAELLVQWYTRQFLEMLTLTSPQTQAMNDAQWLEQLIWTAVQRGEVIRPADLQNICPYDWGRPRRNRALGFLRDTGRARIERWKHVQYVQLSSMPSLSRNWTSHEVKKQKKKV